MIILRCQKLIGSFLELTIDQALQKAVEAHKSGQIQDANRLYTAILKAQPKHPDANHNLGVLTVGVGKVQEALPFFKTALAVNPGIAQFWLSYIDVLIKLDQLDDAKTVLDQAKSKGAKGEDFDQLEHKLENLKKCLCITSSIEKFYKNSKSTIVSKAALGWFFTASFDKHFMEKYFSSDTIIPCPKKEDILHIPIINSEPSFNARQTINYLNKEDKIVEKFKKLKALIQFKDLNLINDSFGHDVDVDIFTAQERTFNSQRLNIVIIGAGATGLFLANTIKYTLGNDVNVLVLDNRSNKQNTRKPFNREWLTLIPSRIVQKYTPPNIRELLECFGTNGFIGLPINMFETVLMLSCKDQGVKFYFSPKLDYLKLNNKSISFFFDATGGRLFECEYSTLNSQEMGLKLQNSLMDFRCTGINQLHNMLHSEPNYVKVTLKASGAYHFPYIGNSKIHTHMIKLTGIPKSLIKAALDFIEPRNAFNSFYVWKGVLKYEFNEGLVLINLTNKEHDLLTSCMYNSMNLKIFLKNNCDILSSLNGNIKSFLQMLVNLDVSSQIKVEQPFSYAPYINLNAEFGYFGGKRIFPIGDSLFCGHPKVGNGLGAHLESINNLIQEIATAHKI